MVTETSKPNTIYLTVIGILSIAVLVLSTLYLSAKAEVSEARMRTAKVQTQIERLKLDQERKLAEISDQLKAEQKDMLIRSMSRSCHANLLQVDAAKAQWAMDNRKKTGDTPTESDLFGPDKYLTNVPKCPAGGHLIINPIDTDPSCSIHGTLMNGI